MKTRICFALALTAATAAAIAQAAGSFTTTMTWAPYPPTNGVAGFRLLFGSGAPGVYTLTNVVPNPAATSFVFQGAPGVTYRSVAIAYAADGREAPPSAEAIWTTPGLLPAVTGYRPAAIVYVP